MNRSDKKPLSGRRILITRAKEQADSLARMIEAQGGEAVICPVIQTVPVTDGTIREALREAEKYDWLLFTSVNGVHYFFEAVLKERAELGRFAKARVGAVGPKTAEELRRRGLTADIVPPVFRGDEMANALLAEIQQGERVLLPRARVARPALPDTLREHGVFVDEIPVYETVLAEEWSGDALKELREGKIHAVTFTSSSTVTSLMQLLRRQGWESPAAALSGIPAFTIGPLTSGTAREAGLQVAAEAEEATVEALVKAMADYYIQSLLR